MKETLRFPSKRRNGAAGFKFVVEGVGHLIETRLGPALQRLTALHSDRISVVFADDRRLWSPDDVERRLKTIQTLRHWGAEYVDKSEQPGKYDKLKAKDNDVDVVLVATSPESHCHVAATWLGSCNRIFIEKPLDEEPDAARQLALHLRDTETEVFAFDHYRARFYPSATEKRDLNRLAIPGGWKKATFYFLENGSGGRRNGPIENDRRVRTLRRGVIRDLMPHVFAVLAHFGRPETVRITEVRVAQYTGLDFKEGNPSEISGETFAQIGWDFRDFDGHLVDVTSYVGKGIRGSNRENIDGDVKLLVVEAANGSTARFDFGKSVAILNDQRRSQLKIDLHPDPYFVFVQSLFARDNFRTEHPLVLPFETGKRILEVLNDMTCAVPPKHDLATYPLRSGNKSAIWLEEITDGGQYAPKARKPVVAEPWPTRDRRSGGDRRAGVVSASS